MESKAWSWETEAGDSRREEEACDMLWIALQNSQTLMTARVTEFKRINHETTATLEADNTNSADLLYEMSKRGFEGIVFGSRSASMARIIRALRETVPDDIVAAFLYTLNNSRPK